MQAIRFLLSGIGAAALAMAGPVAAQTQAQAQPPSAYVDALNAVFGKHPGARASHAKGVCANGHFEASGDAAAVTRAPFLKSGQTPVRARFSIGGGNPKASDQSKMRGLAMRFDKAGSEVTDIVAASAPMFFVGKLEHFIPFLQARQPDPATGKPNPDKVKAFNESHPDTKPQIDYLAKSPVYTSYATTPYWAANAFRFTNSMGESVYGRWRFEPVAGRTALEGDALKAAGTDFLSGELADRLKSGPVRFDVYLQIAESGDPVNDPSVSWPDSRKQIKVGQVQLTQFEDQICDPVMFDPLMLASGIEPSDDPILNIRRAVYVESLARRQAR